MNSSLKYHVLFLTLFSFLVSNSDLRAQNKNHVIELKCVPIDTVRIAFIGLGHRGKRAIQRFTQIEGVKIVALCDLVQENLNLSQKTLTDHKLPKADLYSGPSDWKKICERNDIDLIYVATHWGLHTPIAKYAMENNKHVALEVPAALTIKECWDLVKTAEKTRKHCIMLENATYDFFEHSVLQMAQKGVFGEIKHAEGAYIHDLRNGLFHPDGYWNRWRLKHMVEFDGNTYPTHGIGPIAQVLNIHRGDRMGYLVSMSSKEINLTEYQKRKFSKDSTIKSSSYKKGDINTTLIKTVKGKTILLQHDVASPRPYSRIYAISGSKGFVRKYPDEKIALEPRPHHFMDDAKKDSLVEANKHPMVIELEAKAKQVGGHGGMDFIMDYRLIYCLRNGLPLDMDVYDAAEWSCIIDLSKKSVKKNGKPIKVPDFTRGAWQNAKPVTFYMN